MINFFNYSSLTLQQHADRRTGVGGSEIREYILEGKWAELYDIKTGATQRESMAFEMAPMMGIFIEPFHRDWFEHTQKRAIVTDTKTHRLTDAPYCLTNIDGWLKQEDGLFPWEGKFVGSFWKWDDVVRKYMPQLQWIMFVTGRAQIAFSVLLGNQSMKWEWIPADRGYQGQLFDLVRQFWQHVEAKDRPTSMTTQSAADISPSPPPPGTPIAINMKGHNEWPGFAKQWLDNKKAHADFESAAECIKELVPRKAGIAFGDGIKVTKNAKGSKSITEMDQKDTLLLNAEGKPFTDFLEAKDEPSAKAKGKRK